MDGAIVHLRLALEVGVDHLAHPGGAVGVAPELGVHAGRLEGLDQARTLRGLTASVDALEEDERAAGSLAGGHDGHDAGCLAGVRALGGDARGARALRERCGAEGEVGRGDESRHVRRFTSFPEDGRASEDVLWSGRGAREECRTTRGVREALLKCQHSREGKR